MNFFRIFYIFIILVFHIDSFIALKSNKIFQLDWTKYTYKWLIINQ